MMVVMVMLVRRRRGLLITMVKMMMLMSMTTTTLVPMSIFDDNQRDQHRILTGIPAEARHTVQQTNSVYSLAFLHKPGIQSNRQLQSTH